MLHYHSHGKAQTHVCIVDNDMVYFNWLSISINELQIRVFVCLRIL
jgi:hypothetical protein